jgi:hypothetical protein
MKISHCFLLAIVLLVAVLIRIWGIDFGLPYTYHFDEHFYIATALKLGSGVLNNPPYAPTGLSNFLFLEYALFFIIGKIIGIFSSVQGFEAFYRADPTIFYLLGRLVSVFLSLGAVFALYFLGKTVSNFKQGLLAAGLLAISFLDVRNSHYAVPDVGMSSLVIIAIALALIGMRKGSYKHIYLSGLVGGLAVSMKWTAVFVTLPILLAALQTGNITINNISSRSFNNIIYIVLFIALGFSLGSIQILINPCPYIQEAINQSAAGKHGGFEVWEVDTVAGWLFYGKTLNYGVGFLLLLFGLLGAARLLWLVFKTGDRDGLLLLSFPIVYFLFMGSTKHYFARYALPLLPFISLFAADFLNRITAIIENREWKWGYFIAPLLVILSITYPLVSSVRHNILLTRTDTRTIAKDWVEANLPEGAKIAVEWDGYGPPLSTKEKIMPFSNRIFEITYMGGTPLGGIGLSSNSIQWYRDQEFDYLIVSSFIQEIPIIFVDQENIRQDFYSSLNREFELVQEFYPTMEATEPPFIFEEIYGPVISLWQRSRPGPTLKIYKVGN